MPQVKTDKDNMKYVHCVDCGKKVLLLYGFSNECNCGREYNGFGQALAPREDWGDWDVYQ